MTDGDYIGKLHDKPKRKRSDREPEEHEMFSV